MSYYEIEDLIAKGASRTYDQERECPHIVTADGEWIGYDDKETSADAVFGEAGPQTPWSLLTLRSGPPCYKSLRVLTLSEHGLRGMSRNLRP